MVENTTYKCCFILSIDLNLPVSDVHLIMDVINTFDRKEILIIQKGQIEKLHIDDDRIISFIPKKVKKKNLIGRYFADVSYFKKVEKFLEVNRIEAETFFIQSSPVAYFIAKNIKKKTNARVVYNAQDVFPDNIIGNSFVKKVVFSPFSLLTKKLYRAVDHTITISDSIKETIINKKVAPEKVSVIHNWAKKEDSTFPVVDFKEKYNLQNKFVVLYAGNIGKFQNVKMIVDVASLVTIKDIVFAIQGDGIERQEIERIAKDKKLENIVFLPQVPLNYMPSTYRSVDINLVTLKPTIYKTALPSKLAFCLSTDVPLIITIEKKASIRSILADDKLSSFVNPKDVENLKNEIISVYNSRNNKKSSNKRSIILKEYFDNTRNPIKYKNLLHSNSKESEGTDNV